jgi:aryl-alcohol dehydrogenase-like predicted oxidoreductase
MITTLSGSPASCLGLAASPEQDGRDCVRRAFSRGINYFFFYSLGYAGFVRQVARLIRTKRDQVIVASGSGSRKRQSLAAARKKTMDALGTGLIDVFFAEYINPHDDEAAVFGTGGVLDQLQEWKAAGWIRFVGASVHDRMLARRLAQDQRVDLLMHRFNMAHRKAVAELFPMAAKTRTPIVAFTATRWGTLLEPHPQWSDEPPSAADCYRYCLAHSAIKLVLTAPRSAAELDENLAVLDSRKMSRREVCHWERYGDLVRMSGSDAFETRWP